MHNGEGPVSTPLVLVAGTAEHRAAAETEVHSGRPRVRRPLRPRALYVFHVVAAGNSLDHSGANRALRKCFVLRICVNRRPVGDYTRRQKIDGRIQTRDNALLIVCAFVFRVTVVKLQKT